MVSEETSVKVSVETRENLKYIRTVLVKRGLRILPKEFQDIIKSIDEPVTSKMTVAIAVQFLKDLIFEIEEAHNKAEMT